MDKFIKTCLEDVLTAIDEIETFLPHKKEFHSYQADLKTKRL